MSWIGQKQRRETRWMVGAIPSKALRTCPLTPLVGACCSGCAHGGSCTGEDEARILAGKTAMGPAGMTAGLGLVEEGILWSEVERTGQAISQLGGDVPVKTPALTPEYDAFVRDWGAFVLAHQDRTWAENLAMAPHFISGAVLDQYKALVTRYNVLREKFLASGGATSAPVATTASPLDQTLSSIGEGASGALGDVAKIGVYVVAGVAAALLLWVAAPLVLRRVLA